ncbi:MAG: putative HAD family phosphatase [Streblomastix strix]|uniref:Putative HAD family phosphatase n=1 Tax=Streblomastix strix TaxID=222440 RepID=A0A5J4X2U8_9EUKA|nr:MAG: putative HAD family phosphatase [Streblomastix strix]
MHKRVGLLLDLDGTIIDCQNLHFEAWREMGKPFMGDIDRDYYMKNISGGTNDDILKRLQPEWTQEQRIQFAEGKEEIYRKKAKEGRLKFVEGFEQFFDFILQNKELIYLVCVTNAPKLNVTATMQILGCDFSQWKIGQDCEGIWTAAPFEDVFIVEERKWKGKTVRGKPMPDPYEIAMKSNGLDKQICIAFEDSCSGVKSASSAGVQSVIGIRSSHSDQTLKEYGANLTVQNWSELLEKVKNFDNLLKLCNITLQ